MGAHCLIKIGLIIPAQIGPNVKPCAVCYNIHNNFYSIFILSITICLKLTSSSWACVFRINLVDPIVAFSVLLSPYFFCDWSTAPLCLMKRIEFVNFFYIFGVWQHLIKRTLSYLLSVNIYSWWAQSILMLSIYKYFICCMLWLTISGKRVLHE